MRQAKYAVLVLMLCLQCLLAASQAIEWSPPQKQRGRTNYTRILGANSTGYYLLRCRNKDFSKDVFLERYKGSLTIDFSRELLIGNKSRFENIVL